VSENGNGQCLYGDGHICHGVPRKIIAVDAAGGRELVHHLLPPIMGVESGAAMRIALYQASNKLDHGCKHHYDTSELVGKMLARCCCCKTNAREVSHVPAQSACVQGVKEHDTQEVIGYISAILMENN
jgi:hypothetical protein